MGGIFKAIFGGGGSSNAAPKAAAAPAPKKLFTPQQSQQIAKNYSDATTAKWQQIMANMGGGDQPGVSEGISSQASAMANALGDLTEASGYGTLTPEQISGGIDQGPLADILRGTEAGLRPRYGLYGGG